VAPEEGFKDISKDWGVWEDGDWCPKLSVASREGERNEKSSKIILLEALDKHLQLPGCSNDQD
jgi:hypothetical protein